MYDIKKLEDQTGLLLSEDVMKLGVTKTTYYNFIQDNGYEKVAHGVYASPDCFADEAYILSLRCPQGVLSHEEALYHYDLIDREPIKHTITIYSGYGTKRLKDSGIKAYMVKRELLNLGKTTVKTRFGHEVSMYDLERTICDAIRSRSNLDLQDFQSALKAYAKRKDKDLIKLMEYAKVFHIDKKIREYMEVLI